MTKIIDNARITNFDGTTFEVQLIDRNGYFAIVAPNHPNMTGHNPRVVYHTGAEKYIRRTWKKGFEHPFGNPNNQARWAK
jgi:hypothetical protein